MCEYIDKNLYVFYFVSIEKKNLTYIELREMKIN